MSKGLYLISVGCANQTANDKPTHFRCGISELSVNQVFLKIEYISLYLETKIICVTLKVLECDLDK